MGDPVRIRGIRINFPNLDKKTAFDETQEPKYRAQFVVEKDSDADKAILAEIGKVATEAWAKKADATLAQIKGNNMKYVYQPGALKGYGENSMVLSTSSKNKVRVYDQYGNELEGDAIRSKVYSGCNVDAVVTIFATKQGGIAAGLAGVKFVSDNEQFGGGYVASASDFTFETPPNDPLAQ